jgi:predicted secreted protein
MTAFNFAPFPLPMALAIYFTAWWVCLFAVLPFGVRNHQEASEDLPEGADAGSPARPQMGKKALATTLVAAIVYCGIVVLANVMA